MTTAHQPPPHSQMRQEACEAADAVRRQCTDHGGAYADLAVRLRARPPRFIVTCARGSSDHASLYGKYLMETHLGLPVASVGPSVASIYQGGLDLRDVLFLAVSQSGKSPDLLRLTEAARKGGAIVAGLVNDAASPLAALCDAHLPLGAGPETAVAATKSYLTSAFAFLHLLARWTDDPALTRAVDQAPDALATATTLDWAPALSSLALARNMFVLGRGMGLGVAMELALKFKETSRLHAEGYSAAEVVHGPFALVGPDLPVLAITQTDASHDSTRAVLERVRALGAPLLTVETGLPGATVLPSVPGLPAEIQPLCQALSFYCAVPELARLRGLNPDLPPNLRKVTETV